MKIYGNTNTKLKLTEKAQSAYNGTGYVICEHRNGTYSIYHYYPTSFNLIDQCASADEVNEWFEELYDILEEDALDDVQMPVI